MVRTQTSKLVSLPPEVRKVIFDHLFSDRQIIFKDGKAADSRLWPVQILRMCRTLHQQGLGTLAKVLPETTVVYEGCLPVRAKGSITKLNYLDETYLRLSTFFLRKYGHVIQHLEFRGMPRGALDMSRMSKLRVLTLDVHEHGGPWTRTYTGWTSATETDARNWAEECFSAWRNNSGVVEDFWDRKQNLQRIVDRRLNPSRSFEVHFAL